MDIVITYVNGLDPEWQTDYANCIGEKALTKRYRDWGTLPFLMRGIEECMPFIENVFLVVSRESQVPEWIDRSAVSVVLHKDFIPAQFLPTFNSTSIEMFMHRIEGLSEEFIYFNDDFFPMLPSKPTDFFRDGRVAVSMKHHLCTFGNLFRRQTKHSDRIARNVAGKKAMFCYVRPQHTCAPMLRSLCAELYEKCSEEILASITPKRDQRNCNQYVFTDYAYFSGHAFMQRISNRHISLSVATTRWLTKSIVSPRHKMLCINDVAMSEEKYKRYRTCILDAFQKRFPNKSRFEL